MGTIKRVSYAYYKNIKIGCGWLWVLLEVWPPNSWLTRKYG